MAGDVSGVGDVAVSAAPAYLLAKPADRRAGNLVPGTGRVRHFAAGSGGGEAGLATDNSSWDDGNLGRRDPGHWQPTGIRHSALGGLGCLDAILAGGTVGPAGRQRAAGPHHRRPQCQTVPAARAVERSQPQRQRAFRTGSRRQSLSAQPVHVLETLGAGSGAMHAQWSMPRSSWPEPRPCDCRACAAV